MRIIHNIARAKTRPMRYTVSRLHDCQQTHLSCSDDHQVHLEEDVGYLLSGFVGRCCTSCLSLLTFSGNACSPEKVFRYSNGRFLVNEEYELAKRYARFDIDALCKVVSSLPSVGSPIVKINKKEGGYNKALLMKAENGITVIGKVPCLNIVPPLYATASEVAVLKFGVFAFPPTSPVSQLDQVY